MKRDLSPDAGGGAPSKKVMGDDEAALYDRQIRLWGAAAQHRLSESAVLVVGINGVAAELVKNIVLAGVGRVVLMDDALVAARDVAANFLLARNSVGHNRASSTLAAAQELNPRVRVDVETCAVGDKPAAWFSAFRVIVSCNRAPSDNVALNAHSRQHGSVFVAAGTHGHVGYLFSDGHGHHYLADETPKDGAVAAAQSRDTPHVLANTKSFADLLQPGALDWARLTASARRRASPMVFALLVLWAWQQRHAGQAPGAADGVAMYALRDELSARSGGATGATVVADAELDRLVRCVAGEFAPVCAIVGGVVGQHVIRVLTAKGKPLDNFFIFDSPSHAGKVETL